MNYHKMNETTKQLVASEHLFVQRSITTSVFAYQKMLKNSHPPNKPRKECDSVPSSKLCLEEVAQRHHIFWMSSATL